jgi:flagellar hook-length control protein FliK
MTKTASIDLSAMVANRQAPTARPASKSQSEFVNAYRQATEDNREPVKQRDTDRPEAVRPEREAKAESTNETAPPNETTQAEAPAPKPEAPEAKQPTETTEQAPVAQSEQAPQAEAPVAEAPVQTPEEAQALLALMLATGAQVNTTPTTTAPQGDAAAEAQTVQAADVTTQAQAQLTALVAESAEGQAQQVKAAPEAPAAAQEAARTGEAAQLPASLAAAAQGLGKVTIQTEKPVPTTPVTAEAAPEEGLQNLSLQLLADAEATNTGSITQGALLDDAEGIETTSQFVNLLSEESDDELLAATGEKESTTPALNGERPLTESTKATQAQAKEAASAPAKAEDVMPQILKYADQIKANQQNAIKLQLYPEHLGKMEIKVTSHAGVISAQLTADSHQVKSMLESQVAMLQRTFAEMGLKVDKVEVMLSSSNLQDNAQNGSMAQGDFQQGQQQQQHDARRGLVSGSGYEQWLGDDVADDEAYAIPDSITAVNYVA